jgi:hypothetical protein
VPTQTPEQQSEGAEHPTPVSLQGKSQKPPEQNLEQHWLLTVQLLPLPTQAPAGPVPTMGPHFDGEPVQLKLQQSASCPHAWPSALHGI